MIHSASVRKMLASPAVAWQDRTPLPAFRGKVSTLHSSSSIPSPGICVFAWRATENSATNRKVWFSRSLLFVAEADVEGQNHRSSVCSRWHPYQCLSDGKFPERAISPGFPHVSLGHSLAANPAPGGTSGSAFAGLLPQPGALGPHSGKSTLGLGSGAVSRHFVQECPE